MKNVPSQLYVKESSKSNEETKKDLELTDPEGFAMAELLGSAKKISLDETPQNEEV